jgi:hypothetical protein
LLTSRVGVGVVEGVRTGIGRPDALWAPLSRAGNRRASSLPGRRETIATSGGTGTALEDRPDVETSGLGQCRCRVNLTPSWYCGPWRIAMLDLMAPSRGSSPEAGDRRRRVCHHQSHVAVKLAKIAPPVPRQVIRRRSRSWRTHSITCANTQAYGTMDPQSAAARGLPSARTSWVFLPPGVTT